MCEMENKIELKKIEELLGYNFTIPSYQRGYRWTMEHVNDLIDDINEFEPKSSDDFYCLQPLVVCKKDSGYEVIDGQQRLTTIYFILKFLKKVLNDKTDFSIKYEKDKKDIKEKVFFENLSSIFENENITWNSFVEKDQKNDTIENYYYFHACIQIVKNINILKKENKDKLEELEKFIDKLLNHTKFIWYVSNGKNSHELFKRLNIGKITLTNAELIKALFLCNLEKENKTIKEIEQRKLAEEWDNIEIALQDEEFWYFLTKETDNRPNHIELIFDLLKDLEEDKNKDKNKKEQTQDDYHTFYYFKNKYKESGKPPNQITKEIWEQVRECFNVLQEWYYNRELFHLIGYLIKFNESIAKIYKLRKKGKEVKSKSDFIRELKVLINSDIDNFFNLVYKNKEKINKVLLSFNIATILSDKESNNRFSFARYKKKKWDIEHITPQNPKEISGQDERKAWLKQFENESFYSEDFDFSNDDEWKKKWKKGIEILERKSEYTDSIENLTLLTDSTNRSIGNKTFYEKRAKIITYAKQGAFIPPCSMNVFLKLYNDNPKDLYFWTENDRKKYLKEIENKLQFFNTENNDGK